MGDYLFAYGTLQPDHTPGEIAHAVGKLEPVGKGSVRGVLYDLGEYPGAVLRPSSRKKIFGTVFRLSGDPNVLRELDEYEGFDPKAPEASLFVRSLHPVTLTRGETLRCWVYEYNKEPGAGRVVATGRFGSTRRKTGAGARVAVRRRAQKAGTGR